jgi:hypothetical protein
LQRLHWSGFHQVFLPPCLWSAFSPFLLPFQASMSSKFHCFISHKQVHASGRKGLRDMYLCYRCTLTYDGSVSK